VTAAAPGLGISFFLCARFLADVTLPVVEGLIVALFMVFAGLGINAIADRDIDRKHASSKAGIAMGVDDLGLGRAWALVAAQIAVATVLTIHICLQLRSWIPIGLVAAEAFFGYGYSLPPLRFKVRGVAWHLVSMTLATGFIPFVLSVFTYLQAIPLPILAFILGFSLVQYGWEFANQAVDFNRRSSRGSAHAGRAPGPGGGLARGGARTGRRSGDRRRGCALDRRGPHARLRRLRRVAARPGRLDAGAPGACRWLCDSRTRRAAHASDRPPRPARVGRATTRAALPVRPLAVCVGHRRHRRHGHHLLAVTAELMTPLMCWPNQGWPSKKRSSPLTSDL